MTEKVLTHQARSAHTAQTDTATAVTEILAGLEGVDAAALIFFAAPTHDGAVILERLADRFPEKPVIGCTTAGEFDQNGMSDGGLTAIALPHGMINRAVAAMAEFDNGVDAAVKAAVRSLEDQANVTLRDLNPDRYVGLVLIEGMHGREERVNEVLGNAAPLLSFVGGTAGDDLKFDVTQVYSGSTTSTNGIALMLLDLAVPFTVLRTCSYEPIGRTLSITKADKEKRTVWEIDNRPAAEVYAEALGTTVEDLDFSQFATYPLGLMINGQPWIRCVQQVLDGRGLTFACQLLEGMDVEVMRSIDLVAETRTAIQQAVNQVGGTASGAVLFNCVHRKAEIEKKNLADGFIDSLGGIPSAGFHTYGESWLGHMNCTLTGVVFG